MNKKTIIVVILIIAAAIAVMLWGYDRVATSPPQADQSGGLTVDLASHDFGSISMAAGTVSHVFRVTNPTGEDITITNLQTSCMCTTAYLVKGDDRRGPFGMPGMGYANGTKLIIPAQDTQDVEVVFDPAAHGPAGVGSIDRTVDIAQAGGASLQLEIKAIVTP